MAGNRSTDRYPVTPKYLMTRGQAINFPSKFFERDLKKDEVYGVVIDIPMSPQVLTTMVCFINGAANLYFNNGGDYSGAAARYKNLVQASHALVVNASKLVPHAKKVKSYDLPTGRTHYIYLLTNGGIYRTEFFANFIPEDQTELRTVYSLYNRVLNEIRSCQLKDDAAKRMNPST